MEVMIPTGITTGLKRDLEMRSQRSRNPLPVMIEAISKKRASLPHIILTTWGITNPTKAIIP